MMNYDMLKGFVVGAFVVCLTILMMVVVFDMAQDILVEQCERSGHFFSDQGVKYECVAAPPEEKK